MECIAVAGLLLITLIIVNVILYVPVIIVLGVPALPGIIEYIYNKNYRSVMSLPDKYHRVVFNVELVTLALVAISFLVAIFGRNFPLVVFCGFCLWHFRHAIKAFIDNLPEM